MQETPLADLILFQIDKTSKLAKQHSQREFDKIQLGITVEQWILLKIIQGAGDLSQKELAQKSLRDPASITRTLDLLIRKSLIVKEAVPGNRRQQQVSLSAEGEKFVKKNMEMVGQLRLLSTSGFDQKELLLLKSFLLRIQENMT